MVRGTGRMVFMQHNSAVEKRLRNEKKRRTGEILAAAQKIILEKGFRGATMDDIAAEAGITKPTIYQYFNTKDELLLNLVEPMILSLGAKLETLRMCLEERALSSGREVVSRVFDAYYDTFESNTDLFMLFNIFLQAGILNEMNEESAAKIKELGKKCFVEGYTIVSLSIDQGLFKKMDIYQITDFVWGSFWGIVQVEQNKRKTGQISKHLKPLMKFSEDLMIAAIVLK